MCSRRLLLLLGLVLVTAVSPSCGDDGGAGADPGATSEDAYAAGDADADAGPIGDDGTSGGEDDGGAAGPDDVYTPIEEVTDDEGEPIEIEASGTWEVTATQLVLGDDITFAAPLGDDRYLVQDGAGVVRRYDLETGGAETLEGESGPLTTAATVGSGVVLVAAEAGLFVVVDGGLVLSPLDDLFTDAPVTSMAVEPSVDEAVLWLTTDDGLHLLEGGELFAVSPAGLPTDHARVAWGTPVGGAPALWVAASDSLYALSHADDGGLLVGALREDIDVTSLAADGDDLLWATLDDGDLQMREPDGSWTWFRLPADVDEVRAAASAPGVWLDVDGEAWFAQDGDFGPIAEDAPTGLVAVDGVGRGVVIDDEGVWLLAVGDAPVPPDVEPPGWADDVEPLFLEHCEQCHGATGFAHPMFTRDIWIEEIDLILTNMSSGAMPLPPNPPLGEVDIQRIEAWQDAGFPE